MCSTPTVFVWREVRHDLLHHDCGKFARLPRSAHISSRLPARLASTIAKEIAMFRLDKKLAKIRSGKYGKGDFIIADAKDGDMSNPNSRNRSHPRARRQHRPLPDARRIPRADHADHPAGPIGHHADVRLEPRAAERGERVQGERRQASVSRERHDRHLGRSPSVVRQVGLAAIPHGESRPGRGSEADRSWTLFDYLCERRGGRSAFARGVQRIPRRRRSQRD